jgi:hypothetical protein
MAHGIEPILSFDLILATFLVPNLDQPLTTAELHQEKIHLLENGLKALKMAFEHSKSSQAV